LTTLIPYPLFLTLDKFAMSEPGATDWADVVATFKKELDDMKQAQHAQGEQIAALEVDNAQLKTDNAQLKIEIAQLQAETAQIKKDRADLYFKCIDMHEKRIDHLEGRNEVMYAARREAFQQLLRVCDIHRVAGHFRYQGPWVAVDDFEGIVGVVTKELSRVFISMMRELATMHEREEVNNHQVAMLSYQINQLYERFGPLSENESRVPIGYMAYGAYTVCNLHGKLYPCSMCRH
jgi:hypothetical protein